MSADPSEEQLRPIIRITRKKVIVAGHHGGSWKVAYADFVTAMMAFFLVMWIVSMDQAIKEEIAEYFNNPPSASVQSKAGISNLSMGGKSPVSIGVGVGLNAKNWRDLAMELQRENMVKADMNIKSRIASQSTVSGLAKQVEIKLTSYGMLIQLVEAENSPFFASGSAELPAPTVGILKLIAQEIGQLPNRVWIEGHTDAVPFGTGNGYSNWELSADRANAARRVMEVSGLQQNQIEHIRGYAASQLRVPTKPLDPSNRRVTIVVLFSSLSDEKAPDEKQAGQDKKEATQAAAIREHDAKNQSMELTMEKLHIQDMRPLEGNGPNDPLGIKTQVSDIMGIP
ncbi:MAG: OmpA family protein [Armatimonadetes bacterium]|nr:OmpA family protein [Armatimonadota bacterium]